MKYTPVFEPLSMEECLPSFKHGTTTRTHRDSVRFERYIPTPDSWSPSFFITGRQFVLATVYLRKDEFGRFWVRICFWGDDDIGMEKDWYPLSSGDHPEARKKAHQLFHEQRKWVQGLETVSMVQLKELGFGRG